MSDTPQYEAGFSSKSDCLVLYESIEKPISIEVYSSVQSLFGNAIRQCAVQMLQEYNVTTGALVIHDDGALDLVIRARIEAVLRYAGYSAFRPSPSTVSPSSIPYNTHDTDRPSRLDFDHASKQVRLYIPGDQPHFAINADSYGANILIFDLEDSVALTRKFEARILVRQFLKDASLFKKSALAVRINPFSSEESIMDIAEIVPVRPDAILLPKCESASDVERLDDLLRFNEEKYGLLPGSIRIMPIIESAKGVIAATEIALASRRNSALCFGYEDFSKDIHSRPDILSNNQAENAQTPSNFSKYIDSLLAQQMIVLAARAASIEPLDSSYGDLENIEGLLDSCREARALGFAGKSVIHPSQIPYVKKAFSPSLEEVNRAQATIAAYEEALKYGKAATAIDGHMIDIPVVEKARRIIEETTHEG